MFSFGIDDRLKTVVMERTIYFFSTMGSHQHCAHEVTDFERKGEGMRYSMDFHIDFDKVSFSRVL